MFACLECKRAHDQKFSARRLSPGVTSYRMPWSADCDQCGFRTSASKLCLACALTMSQCQICCTELPQVGADLIGKIAAYRDMYRQSVDEHRRSAKNVRDTMIAMDQSVFVALVANAFEEHRQRQSFVSALSQASFSGTPHSYESEVAPQAVHSRLLDFALAGLTEAESFTVLDHSSSFQVGRSLYRRMMGESARIRAGQGQSS